MCSRAAESLRRAASRGSGWWTWHDELLLLCHEGWLRLCRVINQHIHFPPGPPYNKSNTAAIKRTLGSQYADYPDGKVVTQSSMSSPVILSWNHTHFYTFLLVFGSCWATKLMLKSSYWQLYFVLLALNLCHHLLQTFKNQHFFRNYVSSTEPK